MFGSYKNKQLLILAIYPLSIASCDFCFARTTICNICLWIYIIFLPFITLSIIWSRLLIEPVLPEYLFFHVETSIGPLQP